MTSFKLQIALGSFALITLMLAGAAIGRVLGISFGDALYLTALLLVVTSWTGYQIMQRHTRPSHDNDGGE